MLVLTASGDPLERWLLLKEIIAAEISSGEHQRAGQRQGQWTFNRVHDEFPFLANSLRGSLKDCFYNDDLIAIFLQECDELLVDSLSE